MTDEEFVRAARSLVKIIGTGRNASSARLCVLTMATLGVARHSPPGLMKELLIELGNVHSRRGISEYTSLQAAIDAAAESVANGILAAMNVQVKP